MSEDEFIPRLTIPRVAEALAAALESNASPEAMESLARMAHDEDPWILLEAELALAFVDVVQRSYSCSHTHHNSEFPHLVVRAIQGDEVALTFVRMTADVSADISAHNLAKATLHYITVLERWRGSL